MVISHERTGGAWLIHVTGDVDLATARALEQELDQAFRSGASRVELDLVHATFWDGTAFAVLARAAHRAERDNVPLALVGVSRAMRRVLDLTDLGDLTELGRTTAVDGEAR